MEKFAIIVDTSCDLTEDLRERFGIDDYLQGMVNFPDGHSEKARLDYTEEEQLQFYTSMKDRKVMYKTATPAIGESEMIFEKYLKEGRDVLVISLSSGLSATYSGNMTIAAQLMEKYPERKIVCIDTLRYSVASGLIAIKASKLRDEGKGVEEVGEYLNSFKYRVHQMGSMDDLFFLVKTGRINNFKAFFGQMIGLNLMAEFGSNGMVDVIGKCKGKGKMIEATLEYMEKTIENPEEQLIFVAHTNRPEAAQVLADKIKEKFNPKEVIIRHVNIACGATIGPGLCAAYYEGTVTSEGLEKERAIMDEIINKQ